MRMKTMTGICVALIAMAIAAPSAWAAKKDKKDKKAVPQTPLTESGQKLPERYTDMLTELQAEISKALPTVDEQSAAAVFLKSFADIEKATYHTHTHCR